MPQREQLPAAGQRDRFIKAPVPAPLGRHQGRLDF
jgi:hypothetical protein